MSHEHSWRIQTWTTLAPTKQTLSSNTKNLVSLWPANSTPRRRPTCKLTAFRVRSDQDGNFHSLHPDLQEDAASVVCSRLLPLLECPFTWHEQWIRPWLCLDLPWASRLRGCRYHVHGCRISRNYRSVPAFGKILPKLFVVLPVLHWVHDGRFGDKAGDKFYSRG